MKYFPTILAVLFALTSLCIFIAFVWLFIALLGGGFNIVLPGPGLVISGWVVLAALFIFALVTLALAVRLARQIYRPLR